MMYEGLVLYVKEMDEDRYQRLCSVSDFKNPRLSVDRLELHVYDQLAASERDQGYAVYIHGHAEGYRHGRAQRGL